MPTRKSTYTLRWSRCAMMTAVLWCAALSVQAAPTCAVSADTVLPSAYDSMVTEAEDGLIATGKEQLRKRPRRDWATWKPSPRKATWLALIPGAGQIYNRKYWKLPIVYGAFTGCAYAIRWNNMMYSDYRQAFKDITDYDPATESYNKFLHLGTEVSDENIERYSELFRKRKDYYRRYRDMSMIITAAVYALSIIDAYVDASLSDFDISPQLTMRVEPALIGGADGARRLRDSALGVRCVLFF